MEVQRLSAFSDGDVGGNPAGVVICDTLPSATAMQSIAAEVGYSETAFAAPESDRWRVRYFAPEAEVAFCGHATIALGAALALRLGDGVFALQLNEAAITVEGRRDAGGLTASLQSPPTRSEPASEGMVAAALEVFSLSTGQLDRAIAPAVANAGVNHLLLALASRELLSAMRYDFQAGRTFMAAEGIGTVSLLFAETPRLFHARNPFPVGGIYEDPATGAAAAALAGYLRDIDWPHAGAIDIVQGEDMGSRSLLRAEIPPERGSSVRVSGRVRLIGI
ncbi:MAG: PhzF family phenazine biosynthesis protein [Phenylobacterium sp.]|uniref:PhzF family phenazine biosynthesis protein n=1 Tax=Phenylobacterium sp. TaxID=1871053 RepID=UPI003BB7FD28